MLQRFSPTTRIPNAQNFHRLSSNTRRGFGKRIEPFAEAPEQAIHTHGGGAGKGGRTLLYANSIPSRLGITKDLRLQS
ncbi:hypothetical protein I7I50_00315 [Histoplasma capsulatum G186AR]|uniref:Uncharacterized protein n=1 Tax=Ajellomyces capsulatus TaxID=5037 RepID=A0A8H7YJC9_AJECA|nr:hypothetical protein I7I52_07583 [Histoplasma capsulatum]QSS72461.1 hypothetical protein I7I50_00315 [Histoplasma capsulatum G186AR]